MAFAGDTRRLLFRKFRDSDPLLGQSIRTNLSQHFVMSGLKWKKQTGAANTSEATIIRQAT